MVKRNFDIIKMHGTTMKKNLGSKLQQTFLCACSCCNLWKCELHKLRGISDPLCGSKLVFSYVSHLPDINIMHGPQSSPSLAPAEVQWLKRLQLEALKQPTSHHFCNSFSGCQIPRLQVDDEGSKKCRTLCDKPPMIMIPIILLNRYLLCQFLVTLSDAPKQCSCPLAASRN